MNITLNNPQLPVLWAIRDTGNGVFALCAELDGGPRTDQKMWIQPLKIDAGSAGSVCFISSKWTPVGLTVLFSSAVENDPRAGDSGPGRLSLLLMLMLWAHHHRPHRALPSEPSSLEVPAQNRKSLPHTSDSVV